MSIDNFSILLVDDEPINYEITFSILHSLGYSLRYASNGFNALEQIEISQPDVVLLDVMMPGLSGIEVCHQIRSHRDWSYIPIIMLTALDTQEDLERCLNAGADDFVSKPVGAIELRARVRAALRIKQQHDTLQSALKMREDMANMLVHDFRNPLSTIVLACDILDREYLPDRLQARIDRIKIAEQQLWSMTESMLLMAKIESGNILVTPQDVDVCSVAQSCIDELHSIAIQKKIQINKKFPTDKQLHRVDQLLLRRVLDNLLSNAIKYSPSSSTVMMEIVYLDNQQIQIQVMDMGPGISDDLKERVFEKYEVGVLTEDIPQIGLGLAFCKMAISAHNGSILVKDNHPKGTIISIELQSAIESVR